MTLEIEKLKEQAQFDKILLRQRIGSETYAIANKKDLDNLIIVSKKENPARLYFIDGQDYFVYDRESFGRLLLPGPHLSELAYDPGWLPAPLANEIARTKYKDFILEGECVCPEFNMFEHKKLIYENLLEFGELNYFNPLVQCRNGGCLKLMCYPLYYIYAFENGSLELTDEQQNTLQLCHDGNLPISESVKLRKKIEDLLAKC